MSKPIIFFSHSSKDKDFLKLLKKMINKKTSNSFDVFQSSDGESIPFGKDWKNKIEENLIKADIMFVFISPNSYKSNWIYFEAGFSYSQKIDVIPIGINGIDIGSLPPPINFLQGFNITSFEGLNNIIAIINKKYSYKILKDFTDSDYQKLINLSSNFIDNKNYYKYINYIETSFISSESNELKHTFFEDTEKYFKENNIEYFINSSNYLNLIGMQIFAKDFSLQLEFDYINLKQKLNIIEKLTSILYKKRHDSFWFSIVFLENVSLITTDFKLSSRLSIIGIYRSNENNEFYKYKNLLFNLDSGLVRKHRDNYIEIYSLRIIYNFINFKEKEIFELIDFLFNNKIIYIIE